MTLSDTGWIAGTGVKRGADVREVDEHSELVVIWGGNPVNTQVNVMTHAMKAKKRGAKLVVVDPYRTGTAEQADIQERKASQPDKMFLSRKLTQLVIRDYFHQPDLKLVFPEHEEDDARLIAETNRIYVSMGVRTINEVKNSLGDEPFDIEQANEPLIMTASGAVPLRSVQTEELAPAPAPAPVAEAAKAAESDGYVPTEAMAAAARRALAWKDDGRAGGTSVGLARAHQLVNRERLSRDTVRRMYSFFARHDVDKRATGFRQGEKGYPTPGRVAWDLWGGDAGASWSKTQWERIQAAEKAGNGDAFLFAELDAFEAYAARRVGRPNSRPFEFLLAPAALNKVLGEQPAVVKAATCSFVKEAN